MSPNETEQSPLTPPQGQEQQVMHMNPRIEKDRQLILDAQKKGCLLYTSPSPRDRTRSRMPSSA